MNPCYLCLERESYITVARVHKKCHSVLLSWSRGPLYGSSGLFGCFYLKTDLLKASFWKRNQMVCVWVPTMTLICYNLLWAVTCPTVLFLGVYAGPPLANAGPDANLVIGPSVALKFWIGFGFGLKLKKVEDFYFIKNTRCW